MNERVNKIIIDRFAIASCWIPYAKLRIGITDIQEHTNNVNTSTSFLPCLIKLEKSNPSLCGWS